MKKYFIAVFTIALQSSYSHAQRNKEAFIGKIEYDLQEIYNNQLNKKSSQILYFNDTIQRTHFEIDYSSNFSNLKKTLAEKNELDSLEIERKMQALSFELNRTNIINYKLLNRNYSFKKLYKDGNYLVIDSITKEYKFDMQNETDTILGFICQKAIPINSKDKTIEIWFTTDIKYGVGPFNWSGLPGAILKMKWNNGQSILVAKKIELPLAQSFVDDLSKFTLITQQTFDNIKLKPIKEILGNGN